MPKVSFHLDISHDFSSLASLKVEWDAIAKANPSPDIFSSCSFAQAWWRAYGKDKRLHLATLRDSQNRLVLAAALSQDKPESKQWQLIGNVRGDYCHIVFDHNNPSVFFHFLTRLKEIGNWNTLVWTRMNFPASVLRNAPGLYFSSSTAWRKLKTIFNPGTSPGAVSIHSEHPFIDREKLKQLSGLLKEYNYKRQIKKLEKLGTFTYDCISDPEQIRKGFEHFFPLYAKTAKAAGWTNLFQEQPNIDFYHNLCDVFGNSSALRLDRLLLDDKWIAAHFGFHWQGRDFFYKPCFDPEFASYRPGKLLLAHIIRRAWQDGSQELDLLKGMEPYKERYASACRTTYNIHISRNGGTYLMQRFKNFMWNC